MPKAQFFTHRMCASIGTLWMSKCEHVKWITTPSSRVSPHLLSQRGHTRRAHIRDSPLIMPLVAWWVFEWITSDWRTLFWCDAIDNFVVAIRYSVPYDTRFLATAVARVTFLLKVSACISTPNRWVRTYFPPQCAIAQFMMQSINSWSGARIHGEANSRWKPKLRYLDA